MNDVVDDIQEENVGDDGDDSSDKDWGKTHRRTSVKKIMLIWKMR